VSTWVWTTIVAVALALGPAPAWSQSTHFSSAFKASVDKAMAQPTPDGRTQTLIKALDGGTDDEVFALLPLLFTAKIINGADNVHVCSPEVSDLLGFERSYLKSSSAAQKFFPKEHAATMRSITYSLITCLDQHYSNGALRFPHASSN